MSSYILYCGNSTIAVGDKPSELADYQSIEFYDSLAADCLDGKLNGCFHIAGDGEALLGRFRQSCKYIEAAGGYVQNAEGKVLVIVRNGLYDLAKGKVEPGEDIETAAVREVEEETGVNGPKIVHKLLDTYHFYRWGNDPEVVFKKTYWYLMSIDGCPKTNPQLEEGITECIWADDSMLDAMVEKTHRNLKILFKLKKDGQL